MKPTMMTKTAALLLLLGAATQARAAPPTGTAIDHGAYVTLGKPPNGGVDFTFGWNTSAQFEAPAAGYWLGIYDDTNLHYVWASDNVLPQLSYPAPGKVEWDSVRMHYADATTLPPGNYTINFFVRSSYSPATNVAVVQLPFTVR